jgi:regulator of sirC expression with transglutaminase-like and TPR domain
MRALQDLLANESEWPLDLAATLIARIEFPELEIEPVLAQFDEMARVIAARNPVSGEEFVASMNRYLFEELGFQGNDFDYYDPRNSCINEVLRRRLGIPITLAVVYIEIGRRLQRPVHGIGLPGHFICGYNDGRYSVFIDPFHKGRLLTLSECEDLVQDRAGVSIENRAVAFRRATKRQILTRMLQNLKGIYYRKQMWPKALQVSNLLVAAYPNAPEEVRARAAAQLQMRRFPAAKADLSRYLELAPRADDADKIREQIRNLDKWSAQWN